MFIYDFNQGGFVALPQCLDDFRMNFDNYPAYWFLFQSRDTSHSKLPVHVIVRTANDYEQKQTTQEFQLLGVEVRHLRRLTPKAPVCCHRSLPIPMQMLLQVGVGYLDAEYVKLDEGVAFDIDDQLINAPEWNINAAAQYTINLGDMGSLTPRLDLSHNSKVANDDRNTPLLIQDSYTLLNLSLTWRDVNDVWSITAAGRNVTDEAYLITGFSNNNGTEGVYGLPATWSVSLRRNFN